MWETTYLGLMTVIVASALFTLYLKLLLTKNNHNTFLILNLKEAQLCYCRINWANLISITDNRYLPKRNYWNDFGTKAHLKTINIHLFQ
jgi:hypothetical protein